GPVEARRQELRRAAEAIAVERALRVAPRVGELRAHHVLELGERRAAEHAGLDDEPHRYVDPHLHLTFLIASPSRFSSSSTSARTALSSISARRTKISTLNWYAIVSWLPETVRVGFGSPAMLRDGHRGGRLGLRGRLQA